MQPSLRKYLEDIQSATEEIIGFLQGITLPHYLQDLMLRRAVERDFIIIGEAISKVVHRFPESRARIDNIRKIANFRHFLVREYNDVDDRLVWDIAARSVPVLHAQVLLWAEELDANQP